MKVSLKEPSKIRGCERHHVFFGRNRQNSEEYKCVIYLTPEEHRGTHGVHNDIDFDRTLKAMYQRKLERAGWTREEFIATFRGNYLDD